MNFSLNLYCGSEILWDNRAFTEGLEPQLMCGPACPCLSPPWDRFSTSHSLALWCPSLPWSLPSHLHSMTSVTLCHWQCPGCKHEEVQGKVCTPFTSKKGQCSGCSHPKLSALRHVQPVTWQGPLAHPLACLSLEVTIPWGSPLLCGLWEMEIDFSTPSGTLHYYFTPCKSCKQPLVLTDDKKKRVNGIILTHMYLSEMRSFLVPSKEESDILQWGQRGCKAETRSGTNSIAVSFLGETQVILLWGQLSMILILIDCGCSGDGLHLHNMSQIIFLLQ